MGFPVNFQLRKNRKNVHFCLRLAGEGKAIHVHRTCTYSYLDMMASLIQPLKSASSLHEVMNLVDFIQLEFRCNQHNLDTHRLSIEIF